MKYMKTILSSIILVFSLSQGISGQTQNDTVKAYLSKTAVNIDGLADEECWTVADWHAIDQVWIPWGVTMKAGDFEGRFKVAWDTEFLYVLVEIVDDSLSDDYTDPLSHWWDDDCLEIFIDEDRSMGDHERNCNAFAYHVSLFYDAIDLNSSGTGINYKDNLKVKMDTIGDNKYLWEFAIKIYDETFNISNPEASRVILSHDKLMGFAIAYCDNDETTSRENFIGSMYMPQSNYNDMYKNADFFGPMRLIDPDYIDPASSGIQLKGFSINIAPNPVTERSIFRIGNGWSGETRITVYNITGQAVYESNFETSGILVWKAVDYKGRKLPAGIYLYKVYDTLNNKNITGRLIISNH